MGLTVSHSSSIAEITMCFGYCFFTCGGAVSWQRFGQGVDAEEVETLDVRKLVPQRPAQLVERADAFENLPLLVG
ncbi:MAG: hypothetical protein OXQ84_18650 [bacterium]|nr:hypothetical protein [bacterium]